MKKIAIIILNWNRKDETIECIKSLSHINYSNLQCEIVVVDNASTDGSIKELGKLKLKFKIKIIINKSNLGFAAGNNVGIRYALKNNFDAILILNNDTFVDKNLLVELVNIADKSNNWGMISPKIYFAKGFEFHKNKYSKKDLGKVIWSAGGEIDWNNVFGKNRGVDEVDEGQYDSDEEIEFATGACVFINSEALSKCGQFDERYFMYFEDVDLSVRFKESGFKIYYAPKAVLWHKVAQSSGIGGGLNDYFITRNRMLFATLYAPFRTRFAILREATKLLVVGRKWQKRGVIDFFTGKFGNGSWVV